ncbi:MAG: nickel pincer cofactor biosynthesis protein LarB [Nitrospirota bacterium]
MDHDYIKDILRDVKSGGLSIEDAIGVLKDLPYEDIGIASIDHHRHIRQGFPEVIFCEGKSRDEIVEIVKRMVKASANILATRADEETYISIKGIYEKAVYNKRAGVIVIEQKKRKRRGNILIITAGTSDIPVAEEAKVTAEIMGSRVSRLYDVGVAGIHRIFNRREMIQEARVVIVIAGMDGALPSVIGGIVASPVIAVPTSGGYGANFGGLSALLSMLNSCAAGIGVVNIDNGFGAGCLAHRINILSGETER